MGEERGRTEEDARVKIYRLPTSRRGEQKAVGNGDAKFLRWVSCRGSKRDDETLLTV
jgi:hypothetical protein